MKIFLDMDGCLTAFDPMVKTLGSKASEGLSEEATDSQKQAMYDAIEEAGLKFWSTMPWKNDGKSLWTLVKPFNPVLLSSPGKFSFAENGKLLWIKRNIPGTTVYFSNSKSEYVDPYDTSILIDDMKKNISAWEEAGGVGILHTSTENTERIFLELVWDVPHIDPSQKYW
jgi:hypothetical protein